MASKKMKHILITKMFVALNITIRWKDNMLNHETIRKLREMKLIGMADAFEEQLGIGHATQLSFEERIGMLVDAEHTSRNSRRINRLLKEANLREKSACVEDIHFVASRGLERSVVSSLALCDWIHRGINLLMTGPTGTGKTWLACAFGSHACRRNLSTRFFRISLLLEEMALHHADGSFRQKLNQLAKVDLLILDDLGTGSLNPMARNDLLEIIEQRTGSKSTIITSQMPTGRWHEYLAIGNSTIADALMDRMQGGATRIELKGESLRKQPPKSRKNGD